MRRVLRTAATSPACRATSAHLGPSRCRARSAGDVPYAALLFSTFSLYEEAICGCLDRSADVFSRALAGCLCGATATFLTYPLDVLRARFAADTSVWTSTAATPTQPKYSGYLQGVREIAAKEARPLQPSQSLHRYSRYSRLRPRRRGRFSTVSPPLQPAGHHAGRGATLHALASLILDEPVTVM